MHDVAIYINLVHAEDNRLGRAHLAAVELDRVVARPWPNRTRSSRSGSMGPLVQVVDAVRVRRPYDGW
jgi:hypothetical protein